MTNRRIKILRGTFVTNEVIVEPSIDFESIDFESIDAKSIPKKSIEDWKELGFMLLSEFDLEKYNLTFLNYEESGVVFIEFEKCFVKHLHFGYGEFFFIHPYNPSEFFWSNFKKRAISTEMSDEELFKRVQKERNHLKYIRSVPKVGETPEFIDKEVEVEIQKIEALIRYLNGALKASERKNRKYGGINPHVVKRHLKKANIELKSLKERLYIKPEEDNSFSQKTTLDDYDNYHYDIRDYFW